jgi:hypothetical protein
MYKDPRKLPPRERKWLRQGDIIERDRLIQSGALSGHQEYIKQNPEFFCGFCVLTQTCDLVRETEQDVVGTNRKPRTPVEFIALAMIRRLVDVFNETDARGDARHDTRSLLKTIVNHNYNKRAYFFLHQDPVAGIGEDWIVDLRTCFSLVSEYHYDQIREARLVCLDDVYANKLGWMAGHIFSRVATKEWQDLEMEFEMKTESDYISSVLDRISKVKPHSIHKGREEIVSIIKRTSLFNELEIDQLNGVLRFARENYGLNVPDKLID